MDAVPELPGAAGLVLAGNVVPLDPEPALLTAMLEGWGRQQRTRFLQDRTIAALARLVRRLAEFSGQYPWQWNAAEIEAFFDSLRCGGRPAAASTARGYQVALRLLLDYLTDSPAAPSLLPLRQTAAGQGQLAHRPRLRPLLQLHPVPPRRLRCLWHRPDGCSPAMTPPARPATPTSAQG